jgi:copper chaperone CopZ
LAARGGKAKLQQEVIVYRMDGMTCGGCVRRLEKFLSVVPALSALQVEVGKITFTPAAGFSADLLETALRRSGFGFQRAG